MSNVTVVIPATAAAASFIPAWRAAQAAARNAAPGNEDRAIAEMVWIESRIDSAPVISLADVAAKLSLALVTASRQDLDNDPVCLMIRDALAGLNRELLAEA